MDPEVSTPEQLARARVAALTEEFQRRQVPDGPRHRDEDVTEEPRPRFRVGIQASHLRVAGVLIAVGVAIALWWSRGPEAAPTPTGDPSISVEPATASGDVVVHVSGDVVEPGIVTLPVGSRVADALDAAGGLDGDPDTDTLNLARPLVDGEQILVGADVAPAPEGGPDAAPGGPGATVSLNQATSEQLQTLPGVGPVTAEAIIQWREVNGGFTHVDDLLEVRGIGEKRLADLRELVTP